MADILVMENTSLVSSEDVCEEDEVETERSYSDFSTMLPHISNTNSQMSPVWQVSYCLPGPEGGDVQLMI